MYPGDPLLFALHSGRALAADVGRHLDLMPSDHEERSFGDGEHKSRPLVNVRGRDAFVIQSLAGDAQQSVNDKFCRLLFFLGALKDASAGRVTAVIPYLCYARKDRKSKPRDPVTTRYVAQMLQAVGVDRVVTMDVHNLAAFQNAFRVSTDHLETMPLLVQYLLPLARSSMIAVVSPDVGGAKRAWAMRDAFERMTEKKVATGFMEKQRSGGVVSGEGFYGDVEGRVAILVDDLISSGTTLVRAARACRKSGAMRVIAAATHGVFSGDAEAALSEPALDQVIVTNTAAPFRLSVDLAERKLTVLDVAPFLAEAIRRIHAGGSIEELRELGGVPEHCLAREVQPEMMGQRLEQP